MTIRNVQYKWKPHIYPVGNGRYAFDLRDMAVEAASPIAARRCWVLAYSLRKQIPEAYAESVVASHERHGKVRHT